MEPAVRKPSLGAVRQKQQNRGCRRVAARHVRDLGAVGKDARAGAAPAEAEGADFRVQAVARGVAELVLQAGLAEAAGRLGQGAGRQRLHVQAADLQGAAPGLVHELRLRVHQGQPGRGIRAGGHAGPGQGVQVLGQLSRSHHQGKGHLA